MKLAKELTTITPLSKGLAMFVFITLPFLSFYLGITYQKWQDVLTLQIKEQSVNTFIRKNTSSNGYQQKFSLSQCNTDIDCIAVATDACGHNFDTAINKKYLNEWSNTYPKSTGIICTMNAVLVPKAACIKKLCKIIPNN